MCGLPVHFTQWIPVTYPFIRVLFALAILSCSHPSQWPRVFIPTPPSPLFTIHSTQTYCVTTIFQTLNAETAPPPVWTLSRWMEFSPEMTHSCNSIFSLLLAVFKHTLSTTASVRCQSWSKLRLRFVSVCLYTPKQSSFPFVTKF